MIFSALTFVIIFSLLLSLLFFRPQQLSNQLPVWYNRKDKMRKPSSNEAAWLQDIRSSGCRQYL